MWSVEGDLLCNGCGRTLIVTGNHAHMLNLARGKGWHLYEGPTLSGKQIIQHLCGGCASSPRARLPVTATPLQDDQTLF